MSNSSLRIALVFDWLDDHGGAERVNLALCEKFPEAIIYTSVYQQKKFPELINREVRTTFLQKFPLLLRSKHQFLLPFFPFAFQQLDFFKFDIIISSASSGFSKCIKKTQSTQQHICYCHTPIRYLYHAEQEYLHHYPLPLILRPFKFGLASLLKYLRYKDLKSAKEVDFFIANSDFVGKRIKKYYNRESETIYPCTNTKPFLKYQQNLLKKPQRNYFLALGRFIPYKKFDLLVRTFAENKLPLILAGVGPEKQKCINLAKELKANNIIFQDYIKETDLPKLYTEARAFLFPAEEDFGLTPVESMLSGTPVITFSCGGAMESVSDDCGVFFSEQSVVALQKAITEFINKEKDFNITKIKKRGEFFSIKRFQTELENFLEKKVLIKT